jgi:hypothetical protein
MDEPENSVVVRVTDAPEPYDGFGTHTIEVLPLVPAQGRPPYRRVAIRSDALDWQTLRYQSGLYPVLDEQTFAVWRSHGLVVASIQPSIRAGRQCTARLRGLIVVDDPPSPPPVQC